MDHIKWQAYQTAWFTFADGSSQKPNILANCHWQANTIFIMKMSVNCADRTAGTIDKALLAYMTQTNLGYSVLILPLDNIMERNHSFYAWTLLYKTAKDKQAKWGCLFLYPRLIEVITWHDIFHNTTNKNPQLYHRRFWYYIGSFHIQLCWF